MTIDKISLTYQSKIYLIDGFGYSLDTHMFWFDV